MDAIVRLFSAFGIQWTYLLGQLLTFTILLIVLRRVMYGPVLKILDERKRRIAQGLADAEAAAADRSNAEGQARELLRTAAEDAELIIEQATVAAEQMKQELVSTTQAELARLREAHQQELERAQHEMLQDVRREVVSLVVTTTSKVLHKTLTKTEQERLAHEATQELGQ